MNLKKIPPRIKVFGDTSYRGKCPPESAEQKTFFNELRKRYPDSWGILALHPRNEGKKNYRQAAIHTAEGQAVGASDIVIPGCPAFVCELKRQDHTQSTISDDQIKYLVAADDAGATACVALGWVAAMEALEQWIAKQ